MIRLQSHKVITRTKYFVWSDSVAPGLYYNVLSTSKWQTCEEKVPRAQKSTYPNTLPFNKYGNSGTSQGAPIVDHLFLWFFFIVCWIFVVWNNMFDSWGYFRGKDIPLLFNSLYMRDYWIVWIKEYRICFKSN